MKDMVKALLSIGITVGLSDRESFVKSVSGLIKEYQDDPQKTDKWAKAIVDSLERMRDNVNLQNSIKSAISDTGVADQQRITELTHAIEELTVELRKNKGKL